MLSSAPLTIPHEQGGSGSPPPWALTDRAVSAPPDPPTWSPFQAPVRSGAGGSYASIVQKTSLRRGGPLRSPPRTSPPGRRRPPRPAPRRPRPSPSRLPPPPPAAPPLPPNPRP